MPKCKKCGEAFLNRLTFNGQEVFLTKRKYCLSCSPYKAHNTKSLEKSSSERICRLCGRPAKANKGQRCYACDAKIRRHRLKLASVALLGGKCTVCGNSDIRVLEFHHPDENKEFGIGASSDKAWERVKIEVLKCKLLCANDHRILHSERDSPEFLAEVANYRGRTLPL